MLRDVRKTCGACHLCSQYQAYDMATKLNRERGDLELKYTTRTQNDNLDYNHTNAFQVIVMHCCLID